MSSKGKGSEFERDICKYLSVWLTGKEKPYQFWRMPASGGLATISEENADMSGDIRALTQEAAFVTDTFSIEAKNGYPTTDFHQHFANTKTFNIKAFWKQCIGDARISNKYAMLIFKKKGKKPIIGIESTVNDKIKGILISLPSMSIKFSKQEYPEIVFYDFKDFFKFITPQIIKDKIVQEKIL